MRILRVVGLGIFLVLIAAILPPVFSELSKTLVIFLQSTQQALTAAGTLAGSAAHLAPSQ
jgi:hypothetical protein